MKIELEQSKIESIVYKINDDISIKLNLDNDSINIETIDKVQLRLEKTKNQERIERLEKYKNVVNEFGDNAIDIFNFEKSKELIDNLNLLDKTKYHKVVEDLKMEIDNEVQSPFENVKCHFANVDEYTSYLTKSGDVDDEDTKKTEKSCDCWKKLTNTKCSLPKENLSVVNMTELEKISGVKQDIINKALGK